MRKTSSLDCRLGFRDLSKDQERCKFGLEKLTKMTPTLKFYCDLEICNNSKLKLHIHSRPKFRQKCNHMHNSGGNLYRYSVH